MCTFANNQHNLGELAGALEDRPFYQAILHKECHGTVAVLNEEVSTSTRICGVLENYVSTVRAGTGRLGQGRASLPFDIYLIFTISAANKADYSTTFEGDVGLPPPSGSRRICFKLW